MEIAIGLGVGLAGVISVVFAFFSLLRGAQKAVERAVERADRVEKERDEAQTERDAQTERGDVLERNQGELLKEIAAHKTTLQQTEAELASVKASRDDLVRALEKNPGALPPLVRSALERLRAQVSAGAQASAAGDQGGGEARSVSGPDALEPPG